MEKAWKWLMHTDAKALFIGAVALFLLVCGGVLWLRSRPAKEDTAQAGRRPGAGRLVVQSEAGLGVLAVVSNQFAAEALVVPVNPFRPAIEDLIARPATAAVAAVAIPTNRVRRPWFTRVQAATSAPAIPTLTYKGYFQRPDGTFAAHFHDSSANGARFLAPGGSLHEMALVSADTRAARVRLPDGSERDLAIGDAVTLPGGRQ